MRLSNEAIGPNGEPLTQRERELVALLMYGVSTDRDLAARLTVSESTVHWHVSNLLSKLNVRDRTQVVCHAWLHGSVVDGRWQPGAS